VANPRLILKILISINTAWNLVNFRSGLIRALVANGYEVVALAPPDKYVPQLSELGCRFIALPMDSGGANPFRDAVLLYRYWKILKREQPDVFLGYTVKPNVYGSIAAHILGVPVINNVAGLGSVFIEQGWLTRLVRQLYRLALSRSYKVFFQNDDDCSLFIRGGLVPPAISDRVPGSGVDLSRFAFDATIKPSHSFRFILIARMLWEKGVGQYVEAARILRREGVDAQWCLLGFLDVQNPAAISRQQMDDWVADGAVEYLGVSDDVRSEISASDCVVLPSYYREGVPRTLLEAAAIGRPIITTDAVGCREAVDDGVNGFLCQPRDILDLAKQMRRMINLSSSERANMAFEGRKKVEQQFDEQIVIDKYFKAIEDLALSR
jgi:glycosyltransferase involved in cell wall biosynthesis